MSRKAPFLLLALSLMVFAQPVAAGPPIQLVITGAEADQVGGTVTIVGMNFGDSLPEVTLGGDSLVVISFSPEVIIAELPAGAASGSYLLVVSRGPATTQTADFELAVGDTEDDDTPPPTAYVTVNCAAGETITEALATPAVELTIQVNGICVENVVVRRDNVTVIGTDPLLDGVTAAALPATFTSTFSILRSDFVRLENLNLSGGFGGLEVRNSSFIDVVNCISENNTFAGAFVGPASRATFEDSTLIGDERGVFVDAGPNFTCRNCVLEGAGQQGLHVREGARVTMIDSVISGRQAVYGEGAVDVFVSGGEMNPILNGINFGFAIDTRDGAALTVSGSDINGAVRATTNSQVDLSGVTQIDANNQVFNRNLVGSGGTVRARNGSQLDGDWDIFEFSRAVVRDTSTVNGNLFCSAAADAFCDDPILAISGMSDCGQCPKP